MGLFDSFNTEQLLTLALWREARGQQYPAKFAVGCSIRNRVNHPGWWGHDYSSVILHPFQYSSFNQTDPNYEKFPAWSDAALYECMQAADSVLGGAADSTGGAVSYYDQSLDGNPPKWSVSPQFRHTVDIGAFHFFAQN